MGTAAKVWHRCRCAKTDGGAPMTQVNDLSRSLIAFEQNSTMVVVLEMSQSSWLAAGVVPGIERRPLKKADIFRVRRHVSTVPIVLKKSFSGEERRF
jgi:hypothetical protein